MSLALATGATLAAPRYRLVNLDRFEAAYSSAGDIGENRLVTGEIARTPDDHQESQARAFIHDGSAMHDPGTLGGSTG